LGERDFLAYKGPEGVREGKRGRREKGKRGERVVGAAVALPPRRV
jgi:hypothetical protein